MQPVTLSPRNLEMSTITDCKFQQRTGEESTVTLNPPSTKIEIPVTIKWEPHFLVTIAGILHVIQLVASISGLIVLCNSGTTTHPFLTLPLSWHCRTYIFSSMFGALLNLCFILLSVTAIVEAFPVNWQKFKVAMYGSVSFCYLVSSSLLTSEVSYYQQLATNIPTHTIKMIIVASVIGYCCFVLYGITMFMSWQQYRRMGSQFSAHHLHSTLTPQTSVENTGKT